MSYQPTCNNCVFKQTGYKREAVRFGRYPLKKRLSVLVLADCAHKTDGAVRLAGSPAAIPDVRADVELAELTDSLDRMMSLRLRSDKTVNLLQHPEKRRAA
jgi:hypothetical protein